MLFSHCLFLYISARRLLLLLHLLLLRLIVSATRQLFPAQHCSLPPSISLSHLLVPPPFFSATAAPKFVQFCPHILGARRLASSSILFVDLLQTPAPLSDLITPRLFILSTLHNFFSRDIVREGELCTLCITQLILSTIFSFSLVHFYNKTRNNRFSVLYLFRLILVHRF